jgi:hypothetical protein
MNAFPKAKRIAPGLDGLTHAMRPHEMGTRLLRRIMRLMRARRIGVALIGVGLVPLACWTVWSLTRTWRPVDMPVSLSQGSHFSTGEFAINLNDQYAIDIDSENKIPFDDLECLLGSRSTCPSPSVVRVRWSLYSDGTVLQGTSDDTVGHGSSGPSGEASRTIGYFKARKGGRYKLDCEVLADGSRLAVTNPRLRIRAFYTSYESNLVIGGLLRLICAVISLIGGVILIGSSLVQRHRLRT